MLLVLRCLARLYRIMSEIVRARRDFIEPDGAGCIKKHLYTKDTGTFKVARRLPCNVLGLMLQYGCDGCRCKHRLANIAFVNHLYDGMRCYFPTLVPGNHQPDFPVYIPAFLNIKFTVSQPGNSLLNI